ncbi:DUF4384 domain-containing protein, partial [Deinococcus radiopugnans]
MTLALAACGESPGPQPASEPVLSVSVHPAAPQAGQNVTFTVSLTGGSGTWNVALFNQDPDGRVDQLYPNRLPDGQPTLTPGATLNFPPPNARYLFVAAGPFGTNTLLVYATQNTLDLSRSRIRSRIRDGSSRTTDRDQRSRRPTAPCTGVQCACPPESA